MSTLSVSADTFSKNDSHRCSCGTSSCDALSADIFDGTACDRHRKNLALAYDFTVEQGNGTHRVHCKKTKACRKRTATRLVSFLLAFPPALSAISTRWHRLTNRSAALHSSTTASPGARCHASGRVGGLERRRGGGSCRPRGSLREGRARRECERVRWRAMSVAEEDRLKLTLLCGSREEETARRERILRNVK